jgi:polar amino acid transport system substrate-binding protein
VAALGLLAVLASGASCPGSAAALALPDAAAAPAGIAAPGVGAGSGAAPGAVRAATGQAGETLQVGIKPLEPFVTKAGTDRYRGFSIDLWNEIARRNSWNVHYRWYDDLPTALADVQAAKVDVAIAGISITRQREEVVDFSYPMFDSGLEVLTSTTGGGSAWTEELSGFASAVGRYLLALGVVLIVAGHAVWLATRRRTGRGYLAGVGLGIYQAAGLGLVGDFGVGDPERPLARLAAVIWVICGICFVSLFTATVTAQLTVQTIQGKIRGVQDLSGARVVTVGGTTAAAYLKSHSIPFTTVGSIDQAYPALDGGQADAVVFDAPVLEHHVQATNTAKEIVVGGIFAPEDYGIAFPNGSALRKKVNTTLLDMRDDDTYAEIYAKYFGTSRGQ